MTTQTTQTKKAKATPTAEKVFAEYADALKAVATAEKVYTEKPTKTNGKALATAKRRLAKIENAIDEIGIITADNVTAYGERIAVRALKTCITSGKGYTAESAKKARENGKNINASGNFNFIYGLYTGLIADITARKNDTARPLSDGYDIAQTATAFLCDYIGKNINDPADTDEKNKDGTPASILRACFRAVNRYIMGERQREYKRVYVDEIDEKTGETLYYEIPEFYDIPTATDYKRVADLIGQLDLPQRQKQVLRYRLRGLSVNATAQKMGITKQAVQNLMRKLQAKAKAIGLAPVNA